jgi:hypothetical protein
MFKKAFYNIKKLELANTQSISMAYPHKGLLTWKDTPCVFLGCVVAVLGGTAV